MQTPDELLDQLDDGLRKLNIAWESYFGGAPNRPNADLIWRVENCLRLLNDNTQLKFSQRFRLNQLQQRHAVFSRIWRRKQEIKEGGWRRASDRLLSVSGAVESTRAVPAAVPSCRVDLGHDAAVDEANIERLYAAFLKARERASDNIAEASLEKFRGFVAGQAARLRAQGGTGVEASVGLEDGRVKLRLRAKD